MKLSCCLEALQDNLLQVSSKINPDIISIRTDSRMVDLGSLFIAIKGHQCNGEDFISEAEEKGCVAIVCESSASTSVPIIKVKDSYLAAAQLAEVFNDYPAKSLNLIGVTGTNGKSSITMMIHWLLNQAGKKAGLSGTIQTAYGDVIEKSNMTTPDALSFQALLCKMQNHAVSTVALEVSSHALSQHRTGTLPFKTAIFTNLTQDHLDYHEDMDGYFSAKARLFLDLLGEDGKGIVNIDDEYGRKLSSKLSERNLIAVGSTSDSNVEVSDIKSSFSGISFKLSINDKTYDVESDLLGEFNAMNLAQALVAVELEGISIDKSLKLIRNFSGIPGRMQVFKKNEKMVVVDYAHTPDALEKVLLSLRPLTSRLICLFGCGGDRDSTKRPLMGRVADSIADLLWLTDDNPRTECNDKIIEDIKAGIKDLSSVKIEKDRGLCIQKAITQLQSKEILLVAGKGHEDYQIYGQEKKAFCDRTLVQKFLEQSA